MYCLVTGAAGFIGSRLSQALMDRGHEVWGIDAFIDYYPRAIKEANLWILKDNPKFHFIEADINSCDLEPLLEGANWVFHLAAQAGVRSSWGAQFQVYIDCNIKATQTLLEACKDRKIDKFVYASSSSVYGDTDKIPMLEGNSLRPRSPYGVTKLAAENLCGLYCANFGLPTVSLRYFTVFGPWQRPDMAMHRFLRSCLDNSPVPLYGDGGQTRDFTYVDDIVNGTILAAEKGVPGGIYNLGGGNRISINELLKSIEEIAGKTPNIVQKAGHAGDVRDTWADTSLALKELGWKPAFSLSEGLRKELAWIRNSLDAAILPAL